MERPIPQLPPPIIAPSQSATKTLRSISKPMNVPRRSTTQSTEMAAGPHLKDGGPPLEVLVFGYLAIPMEAILTQLPEEQLAKTGRLLGRKSRDGLQH